MCANQVEYDIRVEVWIFGWVEVWIFGIQCVSFLEFSVCPAVFYLIMLPTSNKLRGILVSGVVRPCVRSWHFLMHAISYEPGMLRFWNISYIDSSWKYSWHVFFPCPSYLPFWSYALLKKSECSLMQAISYEQYMLGFWNFICGFLMDK